MHAKFARSQRCAGEPRDTEAGTAEGVLGDSVTLRSLRGVGRRAAKRNLRATHLYDYTSMMDAG